MTWEQVWDILRPIWTAIITIGIAVAAWFLRQTGDRMLAVDRRVDQAEDNLTVHTGHLATLKDDLKRVELDSRHRDAELKELIKEERRIISDWRDRIEERVQRIQQDNSAMLTALSNNNDNQQHILKALGDISSRLEDLNTRLAHMEGNKR